ncbi:MAG: glycosyltransferase family 39 protein [Gammaproteobacteria bacterium]|nr:glycosyltransferase family 39 protein [Gammaproteobacteria bacterium]
MTFFGDLTKLDKYFLTTFVVLKLSLLFLFPITGDEAYFIAWAKNLSWGYYDHPPVVGWVIYALSYISDNPFFYRLFAFLSVSLVAYLIYQLLQESFQKKTALYVALLFFTSPLSLLLIILSNDVTLLLFGFVGFYFYYRALNQNSIKKAILAGVFLGLAFLSKYLSFILLLALIAFALKNYWQTRLKLIVISSVTVVVFIVENIVFNYFNCWNNIVFNLVARTSESTFTPINIGLLIVTLFIILPPHGLYQVVRAGFAERPLIIKQALWVATLAIVIFFMVSTSNRVGLHWFTLYIPFMYILFALIAEKNLPSLLKYNIVFSSLISVVFIVAVIFHGFFLKNIERYGSLVFYSETNSVCSSFPKKEIIYSLSYSENSALAEACDDTEFHVMLNLRKYGREDDKHIDYSFLESKDLSVFSVDLDGVKKIEPYFSSTTVKQIKVDSEIFYLVSGVNFNYALYRENILSEIAKNYYTPPDWLPVAECSFNTKYGFDKRL